MVSKTLSDGLNRYGIGPKLRALRLRKKLGLVQLGGHTGLSPALLSKLERGKLFPTLPTLLRIALVFGVGLDYFFVEQRRKHLAAINRRNDRVRLPQKPNLREPAYHFESLDYGAEEAKLNAYLAEFHPVAPNKEPHQHPSVEFIYVTKGTLCLRIGEDEHELGAGDAIYFDSTVPHSYRSLSPAATAVVVTVP